MKQILLILAFFCAFGITASAQQLPSDDDIELMQRAQMVAEIGKLRTENTGLKNQVTELKGTIELYKDLNVQQKERVADLKEALLHGDNAFNFSNRIEDIYKDRIVDFKTENTRLRDENAKLRKSRDRRSLIFGIAGMALGHFLF